MNEVTSIHYIMAHEKIRNLIFEEWEKINLLLEQGPDVIKEYFCKLWNETKQELEYEDDIDVIVIDREINTSDFEVSYSILENGIKTFNFVMPKPLTESGQVVCLSLVITRGLPRLFTLELDKNANGEDYLIGEWKIDFEINDYLHIVYATIPNPIMGNFLAEINNML